MTSAGGNRRLRSRALLLAVTGAVIALDQWSKTWAEGSLKGGPRHIVGPVNLVLTLNKGAAFSLGSGASPVVVAVAIAIVLALLVLSGRLALGGGNLASVVALSLLCGGALSNLGDRFLRHHHGAVVDFIQLVSWWPVFNVADAAITVGALTLGAMVAFFPSAPRKVRGGAAPGGRAAWVGNGRGGEDARQ